MRFIIGGAFVLDQCMIYKTKSYLFLKICLKIDVNILIHKFVMQKAPSSGKYLRLSPLDF
jgi:hypothetical protein